MNQRHSRGQAGETLARQALQNKGYDILATNWHCRHGEIDIIARYNDMLVFIEVKTRQRAEAGDVLSAITPRKRERFLRAIHKYLETYDEDTPLWRIDVMAVTLAPPPPVITHVEDAFDW